MTAPSVEPREGCAAEHDRAERRVLPPLLPDGIACRLDDGHHPAGFVGFA
jgi:hypothetical protein